MIFCDLFLDVPWRKREYSLCLQVENKAHFRRATGERTELGHQPQPSLYSKTPPPLNLTPAIMFSRPILRSLVRLASVCLASAELVLGQVFRLTSRSALHLLRHTGSPCSCATCPSPPVYPNVLLRHPARSRRLNSRRCRSFRDSAGSSRGTCRSRPRRPSTTCVFDTPPPPTPPP